MIIFIILLGISYIAINTVLAIAFLLNITDHPEYDKLTFKNKFELLMMLLFGLPTVMAIKIYLIILEKIIIPLRKRFSRFTISWPKLLIWLFIIKRWKEGDDEWLQLRKYNPLTWLLIIIFYSLEYLIVIARAVADCTRELKEELRTLFDPF